jgi:sulfate permease, SulP family
LLRGLGSRLASIRPERKSLKQDAIAGVPGAIGSVPDGMACAVLAGVNPIHGLYASFAAPIAGGLTASTRLMVITTTAASALAAGSAVQGLDPAR